MKRIDFLVLCLLLTVTACKTRQPFCEKQCCEVLEIVKEGWTETKYDDYTKVYRKCSKRFTNFFDKSLLQCSKKSKIREKDVVFLLGKPDTVLLYAEPLFTFIDNFRNLDVKSKFTLCYRCESERQSINENGSLTNTIRTYYLLIDAKSKEFNAIFPIGIK